ncbi:Cysteine proteinase inhibitor 1 [Sesamum alatum]|uniref:Cysteine proteinase inhibitor 1 n=1 Tax=Sesamum alatum TaxID=300844 RepID=A0AAE1YZ81_9LAMI|nr:Cysteine proteinase inhibitor 1 [Sesamum alatum]
MARNSLSLLFVFLAILLASALNEASPVWQRKTIHGPGWRPINNPKDPQVVEIAKFAVTEHNKEASTALAFEAVVKGETQVITGTYWLVIAAKDGSATGSKQYQAVVWDEQSLKFRKLVSFIEISN